jgi:hypothetical protein
MFDGLYWIFGVVLVWALLFLFALGAAQRFALSHDRELSETSELTPHTGAVAREPADSALPGRAAEPAA